MAWIYEGSWPRPAQFFDLHHWAHTVHSLFCAHLVDAVGEVEVARMDFEHGPKSSNRTDRSSRPSISDGPRDLLECEANYDVKVNDLGQPHHDVPKPADGSSDLQGLLLLL